VDAEPSQPSPTGAPAALGGTPAISVYKDNSTTESVAGVTLTPSFDTRTGLNHVRITTASDGAFYAGGSTFALVITTGTVGGTSVVGYVVGSFSLAHRVKASAYSEGAIWIDTVGGVAGTTPHVHGTQHNPVSNIADATTLATALKLKRFRVAIGSTITLAQVVVKLLQGRIDPVYYPEVMADPLLAGLFAGVVVATLFAWRRSRPLGNIWQGGVIGVLAAVGALLVGFLAAVADGFLGFAGLGVWGALSVAVGVAGSRWATRGSREQDGGSGTA